MPWNMHKMACFLWQNVQKQLHSTSLGSSTALLLYCITPQNWLFKPYSFGGGFEVWLQPVNHRIDIDLIYFFQGNPAKLFRILICREKFFSFFATIFFVFMHIWLYFNGLINYKCELYYFRILCENWEI